MENTRNELLKGISLATCSYSAYRPSMGVAVRTSLGKPKFFEYAFVSLNLLMPKGNMLRMAYAQYHENYMNHLESNALAIENAMIELNEMYPNQTMVLMCFENVSKKDSWCHRTMFAKWWENRTGVKVHEISGQIPITAKPSSEDNPTLF